MDDKICSELICSSRSHHSFLNNILHNVQHVLSRDMVSSLHSSYFRHIHFTAQIMYKLVGCKTLFVSIAFALYSDNNLI